MPNKGGIVMQAQSVWLHSKITIPKVADTIVHRGRLDFLLNKSRARVKLIQAAAGYGKTTLLSQWANQLEEPVAWLSIDMMDNDPSRFWQYIMKAISEATGEPIANKLTYLFDLQYMPPVELIVDSLLNELTLIQAPLHIVLDDYHYIEINAIHKMMTRFINYLPDHVYLYIASRYKSPFPVAAWRVKSWIAEIGITELAFTYEEIEELYQKKQILMDQADFCKEILRKTDGWAAGVQLSGISEERNIGSLNRSNTFVTEYIMQEVFSTLSLSTQKFLLETSMLKTLDPELCNLITAREDSLEQLSELVDLGILTIRLSSKKQIFRYHQLLVEVLEQERKRLYTTEQHQALIDKIANLLYTRKDYHTAIEFALKQKQYDLADQWIEEQLLDIFYSGQIGVLIQWVDTLCKAEYPVALETLIIYAVCLMTMTNIEQTKQIITKLDERDEQNSWKNQEKYAELDSILRSLKAYIKLAEGKQDEFIDLILKQVDRGLVNEKWYLAPVRYNPFQAKISRTPLGSKGKYANLNDIRAFSTFFRQTEFKEQHVMGYSYGIFAEIVYEANLLEEVLLEVEQGLSYAHRFAERGLYVPLSILKGKIYMVQGQMTAAHAIWNQALSEVSEWYWLRSIHAIKAFAYLKEHRIKEAEAELEKIKRPDPLQIELGQEFWILVYCRLLMAKKEWEKALAIIIQVHDYANKEEQVDLIIEASILEAICQRQLNQKDIAFFTLHTALYLGSCFGYKRIFIDEESFDSLLVEYQTYIKEKNPFHNEVSTIYLEELLNISKGTHPSDNRIHQLTSRERDVLRLLISGAFNREMANQLHLSEGTIRVYLTRIYSKLEVKSRAQAILSAKDWKL